MITGIEYITKRVSENDIPFGKYRGYWSGYNVDVLINDENYNIKVDKGIRGILIPCWVIVHSDGVSVETLSE